MLDSSLSWLYTLEDKFIEEIGSNIIKPSDWHNEDINLTLPIELLNSISKLNIYDYLQYK